MTALSRASNAAEFQTGDVPTGTNYSNLIDSAVFLVDSSEQQMTGALNTPELITSRLSAGNANITGTLTVVGQMSADNINVNALRPFFVSAVSTYTDTLQVSAATSVNSLWVAGDMIRPVVTIVATGTALATAAPLVGQISRLTTVTDGQATGVGLQANKTGLVQYLYNETATSANLYPCAGGQINVLASGAPFPLAGSTMYTIIHTKASGYAVK